MEEIKKLYEKLHASSKEEREKIWKIIIKKNRLLFNERRKKLQNILEKD
jgi:hypothetical protein